jgi:hypothetical protein
MRIPLISAIAVQAAVFCTPSPAADLSPGMWEITVETRAAAKPDFAPEPVTLRQCLTAADVRDPGKLLGGVANPGASGCEYTDKSYAGNSFRFSMQCAGGFGVQSRGEVTFSSNAMNGTISALANLGGEKIEFSNKVSARRAGDC